jgi:hypothetical protein
MQQSIYKERWHDGKEIWEDPLNWQEYNRFFCPCHLLRNYPDKAQIEGVSSVGLQVQKLKKDTITINGNIYPIMHTSGIMISDLGHYFPR